MSETYNGADSGAIAHGKLSAAVLPATTWQPTSSARNAGGSAAALPPARGDSASPGSALAPYTGFPLSYREVRKLRDRLVEILSSDRDYQRLPEADKRQRGRAEIEQLVSAWVNDFSASERRPIHPTESTAYARAVFDLQYLAGRLQKYLDDEGVENIFINGPRHVYLDRGDGPKQRVEPIADDEEELIEVFQELARRHGGNERQLSRANPLLSMRLNDGSRVQIITDASPEPFITIRRHRTRNVTLDDLCNLGMIDTTIMAFLRAAVRARLNVMVVGSQAVGKTSLMRALIAEIPVDERFATLESEFELYIHEDGLHEQVVPLEMRQGNGEVIDGRALGEITLADLIPPALRMSLDRLIVGEVRTEEVLPMLDAMINSEGGSMCTLHVRRPEGTFRRLAALCKRYSTMDTDLAFETIADALDLVVHVRKWDETAIGGRRHRFVSEILEVAGIGEGHRPAANRIFAPRPGEPRAVPHTTMSPRLRGVLELAGFKSHWLDNKSGTWTAPLGTLTEVI